MPTALATTPMASQYAVSMMSLPPDNTRTPSTVRFRFLGPYPQVDDKRGSMRRMLVSTLAAAMLLGGAGAALADHTHVLILPNGNCAILAQNGNEKYTILPS